MELKKKILIVMDQLACGGIEKSIVTFLAELPSDGYEVTLMLYRRSGVFEKYLPDWVKAESIPLTAFGRSMLELGRKRLAVKYLKQLSLGKLLRLTYITCFARCFVSAPHRPLYYFRQSINRQNLSSQTYDMAIAYHNIEQAVFVAESVSAQKKFTWFHTELGQLAHPPTTYAAIYDQYDGYVSSSKAVGGELRGFFPDAAHKRRLVPYTVSMELCQRMANEYRAFEHTFDGLRLLSVGRLSKQKGFDLAVEIFERLQAKGYLLEWTIIGEGSERPRLEQMIAERKLEGFHLVGLKENPYPYFADCDIYVQPSRYEGYCITLAEARMFAKPSVVTDFAGAREQLKPDETGLIVDCAVSALEAAIQTLLDDPALRQKFSDNLRAENANQAGTTSAFTRFLEEETSSLPPQL